MRCLYNIFLYFFCDSAFFCIFAPNYKCVRMIKKILTICFSAALILCVPTISRAITAVEIIDNDIQTITISVTESTLHVAGANGQMLQIYNVAGICVMNIKVEGADKRYELNLPKGCYIVKVGKVTRKISIR